MLKFYHFKLILSSETYSWQMLLGKLLVVYQQCNLCICVELLVSYLGFYLKYNFNGMLFDV